MVTGSPSMMRKSSMKSPRCIGSSFASAFLRPATSSAMIISRTATMRCASKNICSVRQRPMPSAPKRFAVRASAGVSALARTPILRALSAHCMRMAKSPDSSGWMVATDPSMTSPVAPSMVMVSPAFTVVPRAIRVFAA